MITILCSGTRGDVQPYIALAQELGKLGLANRIASNKSFESFVRGYGIDFYPIDVDFDSVGVDPETIREAQRADNILKMFGSFKKLQKYGLYMVEKYHDACLGSSAIIYHPGLTIGYFMAQKLGIPAILASPFPLHKTKLRPSVILYGKVPANPLINHMSYKMLQSMLWMASEASLKPFWKNKYGQMPQLFSVPFEKHNDVQNPAIISCSNYVFNRPSDWNAHVHQKGYWLVEESSNYEPSKELAAFLATGDKPIYIGFGSMFDKADSERIGAILIEALQVAGKRAVLGGFTELKNLPAHVIAVESVPHSWLFPRMAAVCHHGGAGTAAAGFKAGVPSIIVPFALDQFAWAQRSFDLGIGSKPLPIKKLTAKKLSDAILFATQPQIVAQAQAIGQEISSEHGARDCAQVIAQALEAKNHGKA